MSLLSEYLGITTNYQTDLTFQERFMKFLDQIFNILTGREPCAVTCCPFFRNVVHYNDDALRLRKGKGRIVCINQLLFFQAGR